MNQSNIRRLRNSRLRYVLALKSLRRHNKLLYDLWVGNPVRVPAPRHTMQVYGFKE